MQIVNIEFRDETILFDPFSGDPILSEDDCREDHPNVKGIWAFAVWSEPVINDELLLNKWNELVALKKSSNEDWEVGSLTFEELEKFLEDIYSDSWIVFALSSRRFVRPMHHDKAWIILENPNA